MVKILHRRITRISYVAVLLFFIVCVPVKGQMNQFPPQYLSDDISVPLILNARNNVLLTFWHSKTFLYLSRSSNNGTDWSQPDTLTTSNSTTLNLSGLVTNTGRILLVYSDMNFRNNMYKYSDDKGLTWSPSNRICCYDNAYSGSLTQTSNGEILYTFSALNGSTNMVLLSSSTDNGVTFTDASTLFSGSNNSSITPLNNNKLLIVYQNNGIYSAISSNDGISWGNNVLIDNDKTTISNPHVLRDSSGTIWLFYKKSMRTIFPGIIQSDILYRQSSDNGTTWSAPINFTIFPGYDGDFNISANGNNPIISFTSDRFQSQLSLWYGYAGITNDTSAPPYLYKTNMSVSQPSPGKPFNIQAYINGVSSITSVELIEKVNDKVFSPIKMYDDGTNGDIKAGDKIYTCIVPGINIGDTLRTTIKITDKSLNSALYSGLTTSISYNILPDTTVMDVNRFKLPISNNGELGSFLNFEDGTNKGSGTYDDKTVLFAGGFYLSGKSNSFLWSNGEMSDTRILNFVQGKVGSAPEDPKNIFYVVKSTDPQFGDS